MCSLVALSICTTIILNPVMGNTCISVSLGPVTGLPFGRDMFPSRLPDFMDCFSLEKTFTCRWGSADRLVTRSSGAGQQVQECAVAVGSVGA